MIEIFFFFGEFVVDGSYWFIQCVYYEDMDFFGFVYYVCYFYFMECVWIDYLCCLGVEQSVFYQMDGEGLMFVVYCMEIDFKLFVCMDNILIVEMMMEKVGGVKMVLNQKILCGEILFIVVKVIIVVVNVFGCLCCLLEVFVKLFFGEV